jgi:hypothetical protein
MGATISGVVVLALAGAAQAQKVGVVASTFLGLSTAAQELYIAGITDALDAAGMLSCPAGTSYRQIISLAEAYIYRNREKADSMWAASAVIEGLKQSGCTGTPRPRP